ncbi:MAG TPA: flagellar biosynthetic protein FliO [Desulfobulbaceae bacterium]|nr:flagellar biosynthetic protein FliO [Desulfobulbaceae bacterium]
MLPSPVRAAESLDMGSALMQMLWALLIVIGIILTIFALVKKRFSIGRTGTENINVLEIRHIMPKTSLALVEVHGKFMLLGIGAGRISLLADCPQQAGSEKPNFDTLLADKQ